MKLCLLVSFFLVSAVCFGQNLVPNPSFEEYSVCPNNLDQVNITLDWHSSRLSPDYLNACAQGYSSVPNNYWGSQNPASGSAYCGFAAMYGPGDVREYLGATLLTPLQIGKRYFASMKVSLFYSGNNTLNCAVNKLGLLFTTNEYSEQSPITVCNRAQVYSSTIISDTSSWVTIRQSFVADSSYTEINVGNFFADSLTDFIQIQGQICDAYYYVDEICVSEDSSYLCWTNSDK